MNQFCESEMILVICYINIKSNDYFLFCFRRPKTKSQEAKSSNPYSPQQPWKPGVSHLPRATTKWDASPPLEMTEGVRTRATSASNGDNNGLVSLHGFLACQSLRAIGHI